MSIVSTSRSAVGRPHRVERRNRRRVARATALWLASLALWGLLFLALGWLVAAGFYGLLVNA
jgi:fatty acid desaturase